MDCAKKIFSYNDILSIDKILAVYYKIKTSTKHKDKIMRMELFLSSYTSDILIILRNKDYHHSRYNIFLINDPKTRVIMSECMKDKIINHLISRYIYFPLIESKLINTNIATRDNLGTKAGLYYMKKYINSIKVNHDKIYILKCDVKKFFYSIDHDILLSKLRSVIMDDDLYNITCEIVNSTNFEYISNDINKLINNRKKVIKNLNISKHEKILKYKELDNIPMYKFNKGLPIGNMSSQIFAIFYLNDIDHYIKEVLHIKYYIRYMDDLILIHYDKDYLNFCKTEIEKKMSEVRLSLNGKTEIVEIHNGVVFLGYRFILKKNKLYMLMSSKVKKRIRSKIKNCNDKKEFLITHYNGYLHYGDTHGYVYSKY